MLDADISGCFDNIEHKALLEKLNTFPKLRQVIKGWLKAGIMNGVVFQKSKAGTPQGGVISPVLETLEMGLLETPQPWSEKNQAEIFSRIQRF